MDDDGARVPRLPTLREVETAYIVNVLAACGGSKSAAARALGVSVKTVYNKVRRIEASEAEEGVTWGGWSSR